ncbi:MAG: SusC/RagA family TonB-linked outer membrane protein [Dysgonamonadaceae bacterium]|nr:SusC/RagA family TonB-linked outer membrane protein [Dysgonamonadaceae bacterium]
MTKTILKNLLSLLLLLFCLALSAQTADREKKITLNVKGITIEALFREIHEQTNLNFVYNIKDIQPLQKVDVNVKNATVGAVLQQTLTPQHVSFEFADGSIIIKKMTRHSVGGKVTDANTGESLTGVTVRAKQTGAGTVTDIDGNYRLLVADGDALIFSFIGFAPIERVITGDNNSLNIALASDETQLSELVVTGIYSRPKESFTGSSQTYSTKELKMIGNQNVLQSLKTLDPAFAILENNQFGSDPNRLPDIEVRGKTSVADISSEYSTDPNLPLFILDGFESSLAVINELNMDRVANITVLKDAAATAIYGSKAANGVIVVETKTPVIGQLRINYNNNTRLSFADLYDYNLMNAAEKLEFEKISGVYYTPDSEGNLPREWLAQYYFQHLAEIRRGVDTYWMNEPLRFAVSHSHNLYMEGGDNSMRYGIGMTYGKTEGVMKGSDKDVVNGNARWIYRYKKLSFQDNLSIDYNASSRENVAFSEFSRANPYVRKTDENGVVQPILYKYISYSTLLSNWTWVDLTNSSGYNVYNPLYDMERNSFNKNAGFGFRNNFEMEWQPAETLRLKGRFSLARSSAKERIFKSPKSTAYYETTETMKGSYSETINGTSSYEGDLSATYGKLINETHRVNAVAGMRLYNNSTDASGYTVHGFLDEDYSSPIFSNGFTEGSKPSYSKVVARSASYYLNVGYAYNERYLLDFSSRYDGASVFGASRRWAETWAVGLAWNMHNEAFLKDSETINLLKLRASVGNPGNQNFDAYIAMNLYRFTTSWPNPFGLEAIVSTWGNPNLKWQKTLDKNIGFDLEIMNRRIKLTADYFIKDTDPLLVTINSPLSTGSSSIHMNAGGLLTRGTTITLNLQAIKNRDLRWNSSLNVRHFEYEYRGIGTSLDQYNSAGIGSNLRRYYDGGSPEDLWAVRSAGIDPATGYEMFIKKDGSYTFQHSYDDEVKVGNTTPDLEGIINTSLYYKGFTASLNLRYRMGGQIFQNALYSKVENLSQSSLRYNQDKRALYERWKQPGDQAKFKSINLNMSTPISSRFVADENTLSGESISLGYETQTLQCLRYIGASSLTIRGYMNEIFRLSTVKEERGIDYPFARSVSFSLGLSF